MLKNLYLKAVNRIDPKLIWQIYAKKCQALFNNPKLILSFDCDTIEDAAVAWEVHSKLMDIGVMPVYAVPGDILKKGEKVYSKIKESGAQFINHGGREHTYFDTTNNRHASCFFYDQQTRDDLRTDIMTGHGILQQVLGVTAQGWRTPHFGTFQAPAQLDFLYSILNELNYKFSSSTCPQAAYKFGPSYQTNSIVEIPVTGIFSEPFNIMDTWAYFAAPDRTKNPENYLQTCAALADFAEHKPLLINIYGDPSHIAEHPQFFVGIQRLMQVAKNIDYTQYLGIIDGNLRNI